MANIDHNSQDKKKRYHRVVMVMGRNATQDFFTRLLTTLVRIGLKNEDGMAPPNLIMKHMARSTQRSVNDKGLRTRVSRALQRAMENGLVTLRRGQFKLTRRAGVVADTKGKLWLKIPSLLPPGQSMDKQNDRSPVRRRRSEVHRSHPKTPHHPPPHHPPHHPPPAHGQHFEAPNVRTANRQSPPPQQQQHRQIQTNMCVNRLSGERRVARPSRPIQRPQTRSRSPHSKSSDRSRNQPPNKCGQSNSRSSSRPGSSRPSSGSNHKS